MLAAFGSMAACAAGELCAAEFSLRRYEDAELMALLSKSSRGVL